MASRNFYWDAFFRLELKRTFGISGLMKERRVTTIYSYNIRLDDSVHNDDISLGRTPIFQYDSSHLGFLRIPPPWSFFFHCT